MRLNFRLRRRPRLRLRRFDCTGLGAHLGSYVGFGSYIDVGSDSGLGLGIGVFHLRLDSDLGLNLRLRLGRRLHLKLKLALRP